MFMVLSILLMHYIKHLNYPSSVTFVTGISGIRFCLKKNLKSKKIVTISWFIVKIYLAGLFENSGTVILISVDVVGVVIC
jgi:hypothetical protein